MQLEIDGGSKLLNKAFERYHRMRRLDRSAQDIVSLHIVRPSGHQDTVSLGAAALLQHCKALFRMFSLRIFHSPDDGRSSIHVCGAVEYVIDRRNGRISARGIGDGQQAGAVRQRANNLLDTALAYQNVELLKPLCKPFWLQFIAFQPGGICGKSGLADHFQKSLWSSAPSAVEVLDEICNRVHRQLRKDPDFLRLQAHLSYWLIKLINPQVVHLALLSRTDKRSTSLDARHVSLVWKYQSLYVRMHSENPRLLPVLSAWLQIKRLDVNHGLKDAVPSIRQDLLDNGLPPKAWRYLSSHGTRKLTRNNNCALSWDRLEHWLHILNKSRWPNPPPPGFLGLLSDAAGEPDNYFQSESGVPGWFWNWSCEAAANCAQDPLAIRQLKDQIVQWAFLVRIYQPKPDGNQQRRRLNWLEDWADRKESCAMLPNEDSWGLWLRNLHWNSLQTLRVVPLLSPHAMRQEGVSMHNCIDRYIGDCENGNYLALSLRECGGKRLALLGLSRSDRDGAWELDELAGPCNRPVKLQIHEVARMVLEQVRCGELAYRDSAELRLALSFNSGGTESQTSR